MTGQHVEAWTPLPMVTATRLAGPDWDTDRKSQAFSVIARLAPGVTAATAQRELRGDTVAVVPAFGRDPELRRDDARFFLLVSAAVALLLVLAAANVAALCLLRSASRQHELATRLALGGSRLSLARQLLLEGAIIAAGGGVLGGWTAELLVQRSSAFATQWGQIAFGIDGHVVLFAMSIVAATVLLVSIAPAVVLGRANPMLLLRAATAGGGHGVSPTQRALVAMQVALSVVLVATSAMIVRTIQRDLRVDPGFDPQHVALLYFDPRQQRYSSEQAHRVITA